jgi:PAS domain-containing protein
MIEEAFERLLLDYDRVFSAMAIPACLWRRTGEIYKANREFAELIGVEGRHLREGQLTIYELMDEEAAVNYWEVSSPSLFLSILDQILTNEVGYRNTVTSHSIPVKKQSSPPAYYVTNQILCPIR